MKSNKYRVGAENIRSEDRASKWRECICEFSHFCLFDCISMNRRPAVRRNHSTVLILLLRHLQTVVRSTGAANNAGECKKTDDCERAREREREMLTLEIACTVAHGITAQSKRNAEHENSWSERKKNYADKNESKVNGSIYCCFFFCFWFEVSQTDNRA